MTMNDDERRMLTDLRHALLPLHKALLEYERTMYERTHGHVAKGELLRVIVTDPQFAWLRPVSEMIVRIDQMLDAETPDTVAEIDAIVAQARRLVAPDETGRPFEQRYLAALQDVPDAVIAHAAVAKVLKEIPERGPRH
jgi:hypothetical protein